MNWSTACRPRYCTILLLVKLMNMNGSFNASTLAVCNSRWSLVTIGSMTPLTALASVVSFMFFMSFTAFIAME